MNEQASVTITIPTYNSEKHLSLCLDSIKRQTYAKIEVNIIDGHSKDKTVDIAKKYGIKDIFLCDGGLLQARFDGVRLANGDFILLLDSDQVLEVDAVEKSVYLMKDFDMLILEEGVYYCNNFIEKLFYYDRKLIHAVKDYNPFTSVLLPRFFSRGLINAALSNVPEFLIPKIGSPDHAMIYYEAWKISKKIGMLPNAVKHIEPNSLKVMIPKFYRWGYTSIDGHYEKYGELLNKKERFRKGLFMKGFFKESIASIILLLIKGIPYKAGYFIAKLKRFLKGT